MGIRMHHRRTGTARVHATATADIQIGLDTAPPTRPLPAFAPAASTPRIPATRATALRAAAARLVHPRLLRPVTRLLAGLARLVPRGSGGLRLWAEQARGYLCLALGALSRLRRSRLDRRITVFVATAEPVTARPDGSARR
ncbi:hypothetical protein [Streptomyces sp. NPDC096132]|uniref:hypothetical protein n=1 Tax=Streptomyces sp. NPDC096132 TaxID=3366075 RepID=UPI0038059B84